MSRSAFQRRKSKSAAAIFAIPAGLFAVGLIGLVGALLVDGPADLAFSLAAACGLFSVVWVKRPKS